MVWQILCKLNVFLNSFVYNFSSILIKIINLKSILSHFKKIEKCPFLANHFICTIKLNTNVMLANKLLKKPFLQFDCAEMFTNRWLCCVFMCTNCRHQLQLKKDYQFYLMVGWCGYWLCNFLHSHVSHVSFSPCISICAN